MQKGRFKTKLSKKQKKKDAVYLGVILIISYLFVILFAAGIGITDGWTLSEILIICLCMSFVVLSLTIAPIIIIACVYGFQKGKSKSIREQSTYVKVEGIEYYRDILKDMSPSLVSILVDLDLYGNKDIVASLLHLYNKGIISFESKGKIKVISKDIDSLGEDERETLHVMRTGKKNRPAAFDKWKENRFKEAEAAGYIERSEVGNVSDIVAKRLFKAIGYTFLYMIAWGVYLGTDAFKSDNNLVIIGSLIGLLIASILLFIPWYRACLYTAYYKRNDWNWKRTQLGNETAEKIAGLANFIHDFSLLSEAGKEQAKLWDEYLVYAVVLEENEEIVDQICRQYQIQI